MSTTSPTKREQAAIDKVAALVAEAGSVRKEYEVEWEDACSIMLDRHSEVYGSISKNIGFYAMSNRVANSVNIKYSILTEQPVRPTVVSTQDNEPVIWVPKKEALPYLPGAIKKWYSEEEVYAMFGGQVTPEQEMMFMRLDNDTLADALTGELQMQWVCANGDVIQSRNDYGKLVLGIQDCLIMFDVDKMKFEMKNIDPHSVWFDPAASCVNDAGYVVVAETLKVSEAIKMYPDHKERIKQQAVGSAEKNTSPSSDISKIQRGDGYITKKVAWIRNEEVPMDEEGALSSGKVQQMEDGTYILPPEAEGEAPQAVDPDSSSWPKAVGLRQVEILGDDIVVMDAISAFPDIPLSRNINLPIIGSSYGRGEPSYLGPLQNLYNRQWQVAYEQSLYYRSPMHLVPSGVLNKIKTYLSNAFTMAGQFIPIPDDQMMVYQGKPITELRPPELPATWFQLLNFLSEEIDRISGINNVLRGEGKSGWSGQFVEQQTMNARTPLGITARNTANHIKYLSKIAIDLILSNVPAEELAKRNRAYPIEIWEAMIDRKDMLLYDVDVQVSAANKKDADLQKLAMIVQTNQTLMQSPSFVARLMDKAGVPDYEKVAQEISQAMQNQAQQAQAPTQPPIPPQ